MDLFYRHEFDNLIEPLTGRKVVVCLSWSSARWLHHITKEFRHATMLEF